MTGTKDWGLRSMQDEPDSASWGGQNVFDVFTKSTGKALDETNYAGWLQTVPSGAAASSANSRSLNVLGVRSTLQVTKEVLPPTNNLRSRDMGGIAAQDSPLKSCGSSRFLTRVKCRKSKMRDLRYTSLKYGRHSTFGNES